MKLFFKNLPFIFLLSLLCNEKKPQIIYLELDLLDSYEVIEREEEIYNEEISIECPHLPYEIGLTYTCNALCGKIDGCKIEKKKKCLFHCDKIRRASAVEPFNKFGYCITFSDCETGKTLGGLWKYCIEKIYIQMKDSIKKERKDLCSSLKNQLANCKEGENLYAFENKCLKTAVYLKDSAWNYISKCSNKKCFEFLSCINIMDCFM